MSGIVGQGTTFNLPNFHGELFTVSPTDTKFLSMIGGLTGGRSAGVTEFEWQTYDLRTPDGARTRLEGANAPTAENRVRANVTNVVQIFQETVEVSYTKLAAVANYNGSANDSGANPVTDEFSWQLTQTLKQIARDVNVALLTGAYAKPADNATARKTRGLLNAITTNVSANGGTLRDLTRGILLDSLQSAWTTGGIQEEETATLFVNGSLKRAITKIFTVDANYREASRNVGGVAVDTIETDFGRLNVVLDRYMPVDQVLIASLDVCAPRILEIPGKGFLFVEPLAKTGSAEKSQVYGEIGLEYGHESMHALIKDLKAPAGA
jgi:hypothetical protein